MIDENCYFCKKLLADNDDTYFIGAFESGNPYIEDASILSWICDECGRKVIQEKSETHK